MITGTGSIPYFPMPDLSAAAGPDAQDIANFEEEKGAFIALQVQAIPYKEKILRSRRKLRRKLNRVRKKAEAVKAHFLRRNMQDDEANQEDRNFA